jgi:hypothetical protein
LSEDKVLVLPKSLAEKVENRHGDINWSEFIAALIDSLSNDKPEFKNTARTQYITRDELLSFERDIKQLMKSFLDFFISCGLETSKNGQLIEIETFIGKLDRLQEDLTSRNDEGPGTIKGKR